MDAGAMAGSDEDYGEEGMQGEENGEEVNSNRQSDSQSF